MQQKRIIFMIALFCVLVFPGATKADHPILIRAKKIYTVSHDVIENGAILIENGKIKKVGKSINPPADAQIINTYTVTPGFIDMHTHVGVYSLPFVEENADGNEMTNPITPQVRALDSFNFDDPAIPVSRAAGVTTIVSRPGSGNIIGGTSVAVKLKDAFPSDMVLKEICDLKMALEGNPIGVYGKKGEMPATLMAVYYLAEKAFFEAQEYDKEWNAYEKKKDKDKDAEPPKRDLGKEAIVMALKGDIPVHIHCATASEVMTCIRLADQFNFRLSICHGYYAHLLIDALKDRRDDIHFNIGPPMFFTYYDDPLSFRNNPAILAEAGFKVSLQTDALGGAQQNLRHLATLCVRYGMKEADALRSITLAPAEAIDLDQKIGSIEKGKDADLVLLDGDPFEFLTSVKKVVIDGRIEYENPKKPSNLISEESTPGTMQIPDNLDNADKIAISGSTVYTMAGDIIEDGVVLIKNGKIYKVGKNLKIPGEFKEIKAPGFVVLPGLVSPRSYVGIGSNWRRQSHIDETSNSIVPALEVRHAIEPHTPQFFYAREVGITTAMITPGNRNVIGGQAAVLKTKGIDVDKMIIKNKAVMMIGLGKSAKQKDKMPSTRMGIAALLRETLIKAKEYKAKWEAYEKKKEKKDEDKPKRDFDMEALIPVIKGEVPVMIHCERRDDILTALRIGDEFGLKIILDGATDAYRVKDEIKKRNIPVVLEQLFRGVGDIEDKGFNPENAVLLAEAGIPIAFRPMINSWWFTPAAGEAGGDMLEIAAFAVRHGLDEETALKACTIEAARIIGLEDRVGSIEKGKDADILILRGHPFRTRSIPEMVMMDGKIVYQRKNRVSLSGRYPR